MTDQGNLRIRSFPNSETFFTITKEGKLIPGDGLSMDEATQKGAAILVEHYGAGITERIKELTAENERLRTERDGWLKIVGDLASSIPIPKVLSATGTAGDLIAYFKKLHQRAEAAEAEAAKLRESLQAAREAFLDLIADAIEWKEEPDGDMDSSGRMIDCTTYHLITSYRQLDELVDALGIDRRYDETAYMAIARAIEVTDNAT